MEQKKTEILDPSVKPTRMEILRSIPLFLRIIYRAHPAFVILFVVLSIGSAGLVSLRLLSIKWLADAFQQGNQSQILWSVCFFCSAIGIGLFLDTINEHCSDSIRLRLEVLTDRLALRHVSRLPYPVIEDPQFRALMEGYERRAHILLNLFQLGVAVFRSFWTLVANAVLFIMLPWQASLVLCLAFLLRFWLSRFEAEWSWNVFDLETKEGRRSLYFKCRILSTEYLLSLKSSGLVSTFFKEWVHRAKLLQKAQLNRVWLSNRAVFIGTLIQFFGFLGSIGFTLYAVWSGSVSASVALVLLMAYHTLSSIFERMAFCSRRIQRDVSFLALFARFFSISQERMDGLRFTPHESLHIQFEGVWFRYPGQVDWALRNVDLEIREGEHVALVGANGSGKTTLLNLLLGIYKPQRGRILLNGIDIEQIRSRDVRRLFSVMLQDHPLFDDTVKQQILYGDPAKPLNSDRFRTALHVSGFQEVVEKLSRGVETHIGKDFAMVEDDPVLLSGGQKAMLAIARTLYRNARVYWLDEPTAAMDAEREQRFFERLPDALAGRTLVFVSHRFSTVRRAHRIIVLDQGSVVEDGSHFSLCNASGRYAELYALQAQMYN